MRYDWILDVLCDLKSFAKSNGLPSLAEQLDDTSLVAAAEIAQVAGVSAREVVINADASRAFYRPAPAGDNA